jgi:O-antigen/teichoic acid export membrane protein
MLRNGLYNVSGQAVRGVVGLITLPFLVRFLGIREYGIWSLAYAVLALFTIGEAGFSVAAPVFLSSDFASHEPEEANRTVTFVLSGSVVLAAVLGILLWLSAAAVARSLVAFEAAERAEAAQALRIAGLAIFFYILQRALVGIEQAFDSYGVVNAFDAAQSLLGNFGLVVVAMLGGKALAMMEWQTFAWALLTIGHCSFVFRLLRKGGLRFRWGTAKTVQIVRFSIAAWASALGSVAFGQCDRLIVGAMLGAPLLGVYSAITSITSKINSFSGAAVQPLVPALSRDIAMKASIEGRIRQAVRVNALIAMGAGIVLFVLADWVMRAMVPGSATPLNILGLQITAIIYTLYSLNAPGYFILFSMGKAQTNAVIVVFSALISLVLILAGARYFGLLGALAGNVGYLTTCLLPILGVRWARVQLKVLARWIMQPVLALVAFCAFGLMLEAYLWWRVALVASSIALSLIWFSQAASVAGEEGAVAESGIPYLNP